MARRACLPCGQAGPGRDAGNGAGGSAADAGTSSSCIGATCNEKLVDQSAQLCIGSDSKALYDAVWKCLCTGACVAACSESICKGIVANQDVCISCLADSDNGCGTEWSACGDDTN